MTRTNYNNNIERLLNRLNEIQDSLYFCDNQARYYQLKGREREVIRELKSYGVNVVEYGAL